MKKKKLLITGSGGFIASNFIRKATYEKLPYEISSIDKLVKSQLRHNIYNNKSHNFYLGDISDEHFVNRVFEYENPDIVLHMAAETFVDTSLENPNIFITSNVLGTQVLINVAVKYKIEKFIYCSTDEVYGSLNNENDISWTEDAPLNPRNPYSSSKAAGELLVKAAANSFGLNYIITRASNNYGRRQTSEKLIPKVIRCILQNKKIPIYGSGANCREWSFVDNTCDAFSILLEKGENNEIYNISDNKELTNIELVQRICNLMGKGHELISNIADPRTGHDFRYSVNSNKIRDLNWQPKVSLNDGLAETINWFNINQWYLNE